MWKEWITPVSCLWLPVDRFCLSVMTRCATDALVMWVTNEGVLTFRCFPSTSRLKGRNPCPERSQDCPDVWTLSSLQRICRGLFQLQVLLCRGNKRLVSFRAREEQKQVWTRREGSTEASAETSGRHMRRVWAVCLVLVVVPVSKPPRLCVCSASILQMIPISRRGVLFKGTENRSGGFKHETLPVYLFTSDPLNLQCWFLNWPVILIGVFQYFHVYFLWSLVSILCVCV